MDSIATLEKNFARISRNSYPCQAATAIVAQGTTNPPARHSMGGQGGKGGSWDEASQKWQAQGVRGVTPCEGVRGVIGGHRGGRVVKGLLRGVDGKGCVC